MTKQSAEHVVYCDRTYTTNRYPLEQCPAAQAILAAYRNRNTACRRGYVGYWRIENERLFLCDAIAATDPGVNSSLLGQLRPILPANETHGLAAFWYTGELELWAESPWRGMAGGEDTYLKHRIGIEAGWVVRLDDFPVPDRPPECPEVAYGEIPLFLRNQTD